MNINKTAQKILGVILCFVLGIAYIPAVTVNVKALDELTAVIDTGASITLKDADDDGYYDIGTADELYAFAALVDGGQCSINGELTADIVVNTNVLTDEYELASATSYRTWNPIGAGGYDYSYAGKFNGNGCTISGLYFSDSGSYYVGLFSWIRYGAEVSNVRVEDSYFGACFVGGITGANTGTIKGCVFFGKVDNISDNTQPYCGGIVAKNSGTVTNCLAGGIVYSFRSYGGGIAGENSKNVTNCCYVGECYFSGGVAGTNRGTIKNSYCSDDSVLVIATNKGNTSNVGEKKDSEFKSGLIAYLLNNSVSGGTAWYQNIDNGNTVDSYPVPDSTHGTVYVGYKNCDATSLSYTNFSDKYLTVQGHNVESDWTMICEDGVFKHYRACLNDCGIRFEEAVCINEEANCLEPDYVCAVCGQTYSENDYSVHASEETYYEYIDDNTHGHYYFCCGTLIETESHNESTEATCTGVAHCSVCDSSYGSKDASNHTGELYYAYTNQTHTQKYECCDAIYGNAVSHNLVYTADDDNNTVAAVCSDCGAEGSVTLNVTGGEYNGYAYTASYASTGIFSGYRPFEKPVITYADADGTAIDKCDNAGVYTVALSLGNTATVYESFEITKKPLTIGLVKAFSRNYDGTNMVEVSGITLDGVVVYSTGNYDGEWDDVTDKVRINYDSLVLTIEDVTPGEYATVDVSGIEYSGDDLVNYSYSTVLEDVELLGSLGYAFSVYSGQIYIYPEDQTLQGDEALDGELYVVGGLDEKFEMSGVVLYEDESSYICVDTSDVLITLDGTDVTEYFNIFSYKANLSRVCEGHTFDKYGFCSTGECDTFETPDYYTDEYGTDVYMIYNAGELYWFAEQVVKYGNVGISGILENNISVPDSVSNGGEIPDWTPIGDESNSYCGQFDGNNYVISGIYCKSDEDCIGLFGSTDYNYAITNIGLENCYFEGNRYVGALVGMAYSNINNCYAVNCIVNGNSLVGGLVGGNGGVVRNSYAYDECVVGYNYTDYGSCVENCYYLGTDETDGVDGATFKTAEQFACGEVAYLLQNGNTEQVWGQRSNQSGSYPVFDLSGLYRVVSVNGTGNYSASNIGDTNGDGTVDLLDYQAIVNMAVSDGHEDSASERYDGIMKYDLNGDGYVDALDASVACNVINGFVTIGVYEIGDYDCNGVAFADETEIKLIAEKINSPETLSTAQKYACDINADGAVDYEDLNLLTAMYPLYFAGEE